MNHKVKYEKIQKERREVLKQIKELENDKRVQKYLNLMNINRNLISRSEEELYYVQLDEYKKCKHILVHSDISYDRYDGKVKRTCSCIKCGINNDDYNYDAYNLSSVGRARYDYLVKYCGSHIRGKELRVECDEELACAIYRKIKENYPYIDDKLAIKFFEIALDNMRNIEVSESRKQSRIKRLNLRRSFDRW